MMDNEIGKITTDELVNPREKVEKKHVNTSVIQATPVLTAEQFELASTGADAIVMIAFATGTVPERLIPAVKSRIDSGVPVFLLSDNSGDNHGILKLTYESQLKAAEAGAIALEKVNVNNVEQVLLAIQAEADQGKSGQDLANAIEQRFKYGEGEIKPKAEWEE